MGSEYLAISVCHLRRTFRVYPEGVSGKRISQRVNGIAVIFYQLGLSFGAIELILDSLGVSIGKNSAYRVIQAVADKVPGLNKEELKERQYNTIAIGADIASIRYDGKWIAV